MKKLIQNLVVLITITIALQYLFGAKGPSEIRALDKALDGDSIDILYFCDSSNFAYHRTDTDKRRTSLILDEMLTDRDILKVDHGSYETELFNDYLSYILSKNVKPKTTIVVVNMRSFSPAWDIKPSWQFEEEHFFLKYPLLRSFYKPFGVFKLVNTNQIPIADYLDTDVYSGTEVVGKVKDFDFTTADPNVVTTSDIRKKLIFQYMYNLTPEHRKIKAIKNIVSLAQNANIELLFYITPIDYQTGEKYLPGRFNDQLAANINIIKGVLDSENIDCIDMSLDLDASQFSWTVYPNEHLRIAGKRFVAKKLAQKLKVSKIK